VGNSRFELGNHLNNVDVCLLASMWRSLQGLIHDSEQSLWCGTRLRITMSSATLSSIYKILEITHHLGMSEAGPGHDGEECNVARKGYFIPESICAGPLSVVGSRGAEKAASLSRKSTFE
jgi:hypothetical protein